LSASTVGQAAFHGARRGIHLNIITEILTGGRVASGAGAQTEHSCRRGVVSGSSKGANSCTEVEESLRKRSERKNATAKPAQNDVQGRLRVQGHRPTAGIKVNFQNIIGFAGKAQ